MTEPCAACALLVLDWYDVFVSLLCATSTLEPALKISRIAAVLAPEAASANGNHGLAAERVAELTTDPAERQDLLRESAAAYAKAVERAPDVSMYRTALERVAQLISS